MDFQIIILYIGVINDNKFMKVRLQSRVNIRWSSLPNGNCGNIPGCTYSGGMVPNPVQDLGSHRMNLIRGPVPNPVSISRVNDTPRKILPS